MFGGSGIRHKGWQAFWLKSWQPVHTANQIIKIFIVFGSILIIIGSILTDINSKIQEKTVRFDKNCTDNLDTRICQTDFRVDETIDSSPIFLFYEFIDYFQNHKRYVRSKSLQQLAGDIVGFNDVDQVCDPDQRFTDLKKIHQKKTHLNQILNQNTKEKLIANPCGIIANSFFYITFELSERRNNTKIEINDKGITWIEDKGQKFKRAEKWQELQWIDIENEHFINWMRTAGLPTFRKLWGKIERPLQKGDYTMKITIEDDLDKAFNGEKNFVLSAAGPFGGKNYFISTAYLVVGFICYLIALIFAYKKKVTGGRFGGVLKYD